MAMDKKILCECVGMRKRTEWAEHFSQNYVVFYLILNYPTISILFHSCEITHCLSYVCVKSLIFWKPRLVASKFAPYYSYTLSHACIYTRSALPTRKPYKMKGNICTISTWKEAYKTPNVHSDGIKFVPNGGC